MVPEKGDSCELSDCMSCCKTGWDSEQQIRGLVNVKGINSDGLKKLLLQVLEWNRFLMPTTSTGRVGLILLILIC